MRVARSPFLIRGLELLCLHEGEPGGTLVWRVPEEESVDPSVAAAGLRVVWERNAPGLDPGHRPLFELFQNACGDVLMEAHDYPLRRNPETFPGDAEEEESTASPENARAASKGTERTRV